VDRLRPVKPVRRTAAPTLLACANTYLAAHGLSSHPEELIETPPDYTLATAIAEVYDSASHSPHNSSVRESYLAFRSEVCEQYRHLLKSGFTVEPWLAAGQPYPDGQSETPSQLMAEDARSGHLFIYLGGDFPPDHLLVEESGLKVAGYRLTFNDVLRAVHDYFGHALYSNGFGKLGEELAWRVHSRMFTAAAVPALATETRGQNCWVNFGPFAHLDPRERPYAVQKNFILPEQYRTTESHGPL
jgi:hypothetical protein